MTSSPVRFGEDGETSSVLGLFAHAQEPLEFSPGIDLLGCIAAPADDQIAFETLFSGGRVLMPGSMPISLVCVSVFLGEDGETVFALPMDTNMHPMHNRCQQ